TLNRLAISKSIGTVVQPQKGYVPPPLVGIWSRWPYFHNNSEPNLCAVLTPGPKRPKRYYARAAQAPKLPYFDAECNGYPLTRDGVDRELEFDTTRRGQGAMGHDEGIFSVNGESQLTRQETLKLISFLQTL